MASWGPNGCGAFQSGGDLEHTILETVERRNEAPGPYIWTAEAKDMLAKVIWAHAISNGPCF